MVDNRNTATAFTNAKDLDNEIAQMQETHKIDSVGGFDKGGLPIVNCEPLTSFEGIVPALWTENNPRPNQRKTKGILLCIRCNGKTLPISAFSKTKLRRQFADITKPAVKWCYDLGFAGFARPLDANESADRAKILAYMNDALKEGAFFVVVRENSFSKDNNEFLMGKYNLIKKNDTAAIKEAIAAVTTEHHNADGTPDDEAKAIITAIENACK